MQQYAGKSLCGTVVREIAAVFGERASSTNPPYQQIRVLLKEELARLDPPTGSQFPPLTEEQQATREALGLTPRT